MFDAFITLLKVINSLSPLAVIALLIGVFYVLLWKQPSKTDLDTVKTNDLHMLPEMAETLRRMEVSQAQGFATIIAKLNGGPHA